MSIFVRIACYSPQEKQNQHNEAERSRAVWGCVVQGGCWFLPCSCKATIRFLNLFASEKKKNQPKPKLTLFGLFWHVQATWLNYWNKRGWIENRTAGHRAGQDRSVALPPIPAHWSVPAGPFCQAAACPQRQEPWGFGAVDLVTALCLAESKDPFKAHLSAASGRSIRLVGSFWGY